MDETKIRQSHGFGLGVISPDVRCRVCGLTWWEVTSGNVLACTAVPGTVTAGNITGGRDELLRDLAIVVTQHRYVSDAAGPSGTGALGRILAALDMGPGWKHRMAGSVTEEIELRLREKLG